MYYANVVHLVLVGEEEANTGVTKLWLKLLSGVIEKKLLVKPLLSFVVDSGETRYYQRYLFLLYCFLFKCSGSFINKPFEKC